MIVIQGDNATASASGAGLAPPQLVGIHSRELLAAWRTARGVDAAHIERELARRGFGRLTAAVVEGYFSPADADRLRLAEGIAGEPGAGASAWLSLLVEDTSADVRLAAVSVMATSNDPALLEKAWDVALHDRDARFAALVPRLQARRAALQR
jgi:hypothetical protein